MGLVYRAHDPNIERQVALKVLFPQAAVQSESEASLRERFVLEARAAGRLNHPGIATIYDADVDPETNLAFIAMELVEGGPLARPLEGGKRLGIERTCEIVARVAEALDFAHARGVVHRDVKPANILMDREGRAVLVDFGIAKVVEESHTLTGQILGTPAYMSPEQFQAEPIDGRSDQFSLGAVLYECLVGSKPFRGGSVAALAHQICEADPPHPAELGVTISDELWRVISRALAKDRDQRFATCGELAEALRSADRLPSVREAELNQGPVRAERPAGVSGGASPSSRWWTAAVALAVFLAVLAGWRGLADPESSSRDEQPAAGLIQELPREVTATAQVSTPVREQATLVILHENRLKAAQLTIQVDGRQVWSQRIFGRGNLLTRARGNLVRASIPVEPGRRSIEVSIRGSKGKVDAASIASGAFEAGKTRYLRVTLVPVVDQIELDWKR